MKMPTDPFGVVDDAAPEIQEAILLDRINSAYYEPVLNWFFEILAGFTSPKSILEVGCGSGHLIARAANKFSSRAIGIDRSQHLVEGARKRFPNLEFEQADGRMLPFTDRAFDASFIATVLVHAEHPERLVAEMARVTKPGGIVAALDQDFETAVLYPGDKELTRRVLNAATDFWQNGWIGRQLAQLLRDAGMQVVDTRVHVRVDREFDAPFFARIRDWVIDGGFPADDANRWYLELAEQAPSHEFLFTRNFYCVVARR